jgi:hypothetical protein
VTEGRLDSTTQSFQGICSLLGKSWLLRNGRLEGNYHINSPPSGGYFQVLFLLKNLTENPRMANSHVLCMICSVSVMVIICQLD